MSDIYRSGKLGDALVEALTTLIQEEKITQDLALKVLSEYDAAQLACLRDDVTARGTLRARLEHYRYVDNVWTFVVSGATLRLAPAPGSRRDEETVDAGTVRMVLVDRRVAGGDGDGDGAAAAGGGA